MPVTVSSTSAADTGELVRQTSAMEINAQPWLESTHKIRGQQGFTNKDTGKFELWDEAQEKRICGPDDDTQGLVRSWSDAPGADGRPSSDRRGDGYHGRYNKRSRPVERPEKPMVEAEITDLDYYD
ncbi:hypothetical protein IG631_01289 [Alternaria alternata]|nr:hypothetical protein IG631_01289 [Alternaria alternata]